MSFIANNIASKGEISQMENIRTTTRVGGKLLTLEHINGESWDKIISSFDGACQEQLYIFAKNRWPKVGLEPVLFFENGEVVGGALVLVQALPLNLASLAILKWGPLLKDHTRFDKKEIYDACVETLLKEYDVKRKMMVSILARAALQEVNNEFEYLLERGFKKGSQLRFPNRYFVNLRQNDEELLASFAQKWRYHLKKSFKADLHFEQASCDRIEEFKLLYNQMSGRKKFPDHSAFEDTIDALMAIIDDGLRPELFFVRHKKEIVSGAVIFKTGDTAVYLYGATSDKALGLRAGYFIHYHIIRWLRDNTKAKYYDLGGTDGFQGLHQFKKGMVGTKGVIALVPPVANYSSKFMPLLFGRFAFFTRDLILSIKHFLSSFRSDIAKPDQKRDKNGY